jgi:hypothetical protein
MVANLWLIGRKSDATRLFDRLLKLRNDVGLLSEEYDSQARRLVGNFPQALSHIALVHAAYTMSGEWSPQHADDSKTIGAGSTTQAHNPRRGAPGVQPKPSRKAPKGEKRN